MIEMIVTFLLGFFLMYIAYKTSNKKCPPPRVEYRFIPRTLKEEMENPVKVSEIYENLFNSDPLFINRVG